MTPAHAVDQPAAVRPGETLDVHKLRDFLRDKVPGSTDDLEVLQFPRGFSNLTYLLRADGREYVLRRPPFGAAGIRSGHDMGREYRILSRLAPVYDKAPRPLLFCEKPDVLGAPFYVMERVKGVILRGATLDGDGLDLGPDVLRRVSEAAVDTLVELHGLDYAAAGLGKLGRPEGYVARQVQGWGRRYEKARTDEHPDLERSLGWLAEHTPKESGAALVHNDFKYDNLVLDPANLGRVKGVLDWEMATIGDPLMDLGTTLAYWIGPEDPAALRSLSIGLTTLPGNLDRDGVVQRYAAASGHDVSGLLFHYVFGLFKLAVIVQQIYYRYRGGFTRDERFADFGEVVGILGRSAAEAFQAGRLPR